MNYQSYQPQVSTVCWANPVLCQLNIHTQCVISQITIPLAQQDFKLQAHQIQANQMDGIKTSQSGSPIKKQYGRCSFTWSAAARKFPGETLACRVTQPANAPTSTNTISSPPQLNQKADSSMSAFLEGAQFGSTRISDSVNNATAGALVGSVNSTDQHIDRQQENTPQLSSFSDSLLLLLQICS